MIPPPSPARTRGIILVFVSIIFLIHGAAQGSPPRQLEKNKTVWAVFFSSRNCPRCEGVKLLVRELKKNYPLKVQVFNVDHAEDYRLFQRLEAIHSQERFSVPLILVGDTILKGEKEISEQLEKIVRALATSTGSPLPYLGHGEENRQCGAAPARQAGGDDGSCPDCDRQGRPPSIGEEWRKIKRFIQKLF
jgi:thiol-disulfide isomerase/thioredoxin